MVNKKLKKLILPAVAGVIGVSVILITRVLPISFTLTDGNSTAEFDNSFETGGTGFWDWTVNGTNQIFDMSTFIKTNAPNFCDSGFIVIESGCFEPGVLIQNTPNTATITYTYQDPDSKANIFEVILDYTLTGGGTKGFLSSLNRGVTINNLSDTAYNFEVIEYYNLELGGNLDGDRASIDPNASFTGLQVDNDGSLSENGTLFATITSDTIPNGYEINSPFILPNKITSPDFTGLDNNTGPVIGDGSSEEPAFAYQPINQSIPGGDTVTTDQTVTLETVEIPEPSTLIGLGGFLIGALTLSHKHNR